MHRDKNIQLRQRKPTVHPADLWTACNISSNTVQGGRRGDLDLDVSCFHQVTTSSFLSVHKTSKVLCICHKTRRGRQRRRNSLLLSTPNSLPLRMWCSRFFMAEGLRLIRLSEASSPTKITNSFSFLQYWVVCVCLQCRCTSVLSFPTRAVQAASQLSGHHLHDESQSESEHVSEQSWLGAHVHG